MATTTAQRPWEALPHPTPGERGARTAGRQAAARVRECRLSHVTRVDLGCSGPPVDSAVRRWWSGWQRRAALPVGLLVLGGNGRLWLFTASAAEAALRAGLRLALEAAVGPLTVAPRFLPATPLPTGARTPTDAAAREARLLLAATAEGHRRGRHRYLFSGR